VSRNIISTVGLMNSIGLDTERYSEARDPTDFFDFFLDILTTILWRTDSSGIIEGLFVGVLKGRLHNNKEWHPERFSS
jgi:hypothetical protein